MSSIQGPAQVLTNRISFETEVQIGEVNCGPACAMMVLSWFGITDLLQRDLKQEIADIESVDGDRWITSPDELKIVLNNNIEKFRPDGYSGKFKVYAREEQRELDSRLVWSLHSFKVPCIVLRGLVGHWIIAYGYTPLGFTPNNATDVVEITGFYIRDPIERAEQGHIDIGDWPDPAGRVTGGHWRDKFVAICDPSSDKKKGKKIPAKGKEQIPEKTTLNLSQPISEQAIPFSNKESENIDNFNQFKSKNIPAPVITKTKNPIRNELIISKKSAGEYAIWVMHSRDFYNPVMLDHIMKDPQPGSPYLVQYLGRDDFYYLVPVKDNNGKTYAIISVNAGKAAYRRSIYAMDGAKPLRFRPLTRGKIAKILLRGKYASQKDVEKMQMQEVLVWKLCKQSLTPYLPFHKIKVAGKNWYVRTDGKLYKRLSENPKIKD